MMRRQSSSRMAASLTTMSTSLLAFKSRGGYDSLRINMVTTTQRWLHTSTPFLKATTTTAKATNDEEWDELLASSEIEIISQRLSPEDKIKQERTNEFISKLLTVPSIQLVRDMIFSAVSTHKTLQEKHLFEVLKRAKKQLADLQAEAGNGGSAVVTHSSVTVYPPTRAYLVFEAALDSGLVKLLCVRERSLRGSSTTTADVLLPGSVVEEGDSNSKKTPEGGSGGEEGCGLPTDLSSDEEALFAMLLARKNASRNRLANTTPLTSPPTQIMKPSVVEEDDEAITPMADDQESQDEIERTHVLTRVSKIADTVLKLLLAPAIKSLKDEEGGGANFGKPSTRPRGRSHNEDMNNVTATTTTTSISTQAAPQDDKETAVTGNKNQQQSEEDAAVAWKLLALMGRKGLRVSSPKIVTALRDYAHCGIDGLSPDNTTNNKDQQPHIIVSQRLRFLDGEERRIGRSLQQRGTVTTTTPGGETEKQPHVRHATPEPIAMRK